jgi:glycosyltransferase involved in cell wall biosynthesis
MMVCCNAAPTLPWALGSLLAQVWKDWECIFVDDGSTDRSFDVAMSLGDPRIRAFRFNTNRGRGAARQFALENAQGDYLCVLDADDWMYPWRLHTELDFLEAESKAAVVSAGMAILNGMDGLVGLTGVRGHLLGDKPQVFPPLTRLQMPPFPFPPSMIRMRIAKRCKFDSALGVAEDVDFLMQILLHHGYGILNRINYAYTEYSTVTLQKLMTGSHFTSQMFGKQHGKFPLQSRLCNLKVLAKSQVYRAAFAINRSQWLVRRRSRPPTPAEEAEFCWAHATVALKVRENFETASPLDKKLLPTAESFAVHSSHLHKVAEREFYGVDKP